MSLSQTGSFDLLQGLLFSILMIACIVPFFLFFYFMQGRVLGVSVPRAGRRIGSSLPSVLARVLGVPGILDVSHRAFHVFLATCIRALMSWMEFSGNQKMGREKKTLRLGLEAGWDWDLNT